MAELNEKQKKLLELARSMIGPVHYQYQLKDDEVPAKLNCARFIQFLYKSIGILIGPATIDQAADAGREIIMPFKDIPYTSRELDFLLGFLEPADLIFLESEKGHYNHSRFGGRKLYIGHVVLYSGDGKVIHCFRNGNSGPGEIKEESLLDVIKSKGPIIITKRIL